MSYEEERKKIIQEVEELFKELITFAQSGELLKALQAAHIPHVLLDPEILAVMMSHDCENCPIKKTCPDFTHEPHPVWNGISAEDAAILKQMGIKP